MANPILISAPVSAPISLAEAKEHLRVTWSEEDDAITDLIEDAVAYLDGWGGVLGRALEPQTWQISLGRFPAGNIDLPLGPVSAVEAIEYLDAGDRSPRTLDPSLYELDTYAVEARVVPIAPWPATAPANAAVRVRWVAGTGCPKPIRRAIKLLVGHFYMNREATSAALATVPFGVSSLIEPWRRVGL